MDLEKGGGKNENHDYAEAYPYYDFKHKQSVQTNQASYAFAFFGNRLHKEFPSFFQNEDNSIKKAAPASTKSGKACIKPKA